MQIQYGKFVGSLQNCRTKGAARPPCPLSLQPCSERQDGVDVVFRAEVVALELLDVRVDCPVPKESEWAFKPLRVHEKPLAC